MVQSEGLVEGYIEPRADQVKRHVGRCMLQVIRIGAPSKPPLEATELDCISDAIGFVARQKYTQVVEAVQFAFSSTMERPEVD